MKRKRIRIVKCAQPNNYWYADMVGTEFLVGELSSVLYMIDGETGCLLKEDCKIINVIEPFRYIKAHEMV